MLETLQQLRAGLLGWVVIDVLVFMCGTQAVAAIGQGYQHVCPVNDVFAQAPFAAKLQELTFVRLQGEGVEPRILAQSVAFAENQLSACMLVHICGLPPNLDLCVLNSLLDVGIVLLQPFAQVGKDPWEIHIAGLPLGKTSVRCLYPLVELFGIEFVAQLGPALRALLLSLIETSLFG